MSEFIDISGHFYVTLRRDEIDDAYAEAVKNVLTEGDPLRFEFADVADDYDCFYLSDRDKYD